MTLNLSFWRFVIFLNFAKSLTWGKDGVTYFFHIGTFTNGESTGLSIIILPISIQLGFVVRK